MNGTTIIFDDKMLEAVEVYNLTLEVDPGFERVRVSEPKSAAVYIEDNDGEWHCTSGISSSAIVVSYFMRTLLCLQYTIGLPYYRNTSEPCMLGTHLNRCMSIYVGACIGVYIRYRQ